MTLSANLIDMNISEQNHYIDIHTHSLVHADDVIQIINLFPEQLISPLAAPFFYSVGWHPWYLRKENNDAYLKIVSDGGLKPEILCIGECGLDRLSEVAFEYQIEVFKQQALIAERVQKPLLLHCVRSANEIIKLKKEIKPKMPWIIHGYNSNFVTGLELIRHGLYISIGIDLLKDISNAFNFLPEIPLDRLFFESGDMDIHVGKIYQKAASKLDIELLALKKQIQSNFNLVFIKE
jgi:TatD DNase family protein